MIESKYKCKKCGSSNWRVNIYQNVDCKLDKDGNYVDVGFDFSDPEPEKDKIWCEKCGEFKE